MKSPFFAVGCVFLSMAACSAPQGKKLASHGTGLAPVAEGPGGGSANSRQAPVATGPTTKAANLAIGDSGGAVSLYKEGTVTVTLDSSQKDGYQWRLSEIPDPTVLKLVSQDFVPGATPEARGQEKWVFQAVGPGDVDVKMWYGDLRTSPLSGSSTYNFVASVGDQTEPVKKTKKAKSKKA